ncbi:BON domain-containing protein [Legionella sp. MW5194]|uniref:BON domain-containing protein n=1 Tax=Legionella sp. MW5194 TaxID=2662448 RepID=UPI00193DC1DE|nr:BON domain-containing protein [Legionella sp. MW5194]
MDRLRLKATALLILGGLSFSPLVGANAVPADTTTTTTTTPVTTTTTTEGTTTEGTATVKTSDADFQHAVEAALAQYPDVKVTVTNGIVYLDGQLASDTDYEKVVMLTESVEGIGDVNADNLTVKDSRAPLADTYITAKVKAAILKSDIMGRDIPSWSVSVETKNGKVILSGEVASAQQKQAIMTVVNSVKGVKGVDDQLTLSGDDSLTE